MTKATMKQHRTPLTLLSALLATGATVITAEPKPADPPDPVKIASGLKAPSGYELTVFAHPPQVNYPTVVAATPAGGLFVGIDEQGSLGKTPGKGRVVYCPDEDGNGKADRVIDFAKMDHPRGLTWDDGVLYVLHPPFITKYYDDNGDFVADRSEVLVQGIVLEQTQKQRGADHTTNGMRLGVDGWLYIAMGDFGARAEGKDGTKLEVFGGGVVRVRIDGTGLEQYSWGQRNIYDVAVDPFMNCFTRDNTNDGDGWDVRLSHVVPTGRYGYPSLYKNFADETVRPLAEYGGGSPCGALFVDEPNGSGLYTVEWGRSAIMKHPLTPDGASFKAAQEKWFDVPRPTDMDVDASGRLFIASWKDGGFNYGGPNVGYVVRLAPEGGQVVKPIDVKKATEGQLLKEMTAASGVLRMAAQRELLKRGASEAVVGGLMNIATSNAPLQVKAGSVFTLGQVAGGQKALLELAKRDDVREFALRALADRKGADVPAAPFVAGLRDANPRVRLQAAWGLSRIGKTSDAAALVPLLGDPDGNVAHVAINGLVSLNAIDDCLNAVDSSNPTLLGGALRALQRMHDPKVVDGLVEKLGKTQDASMRGPILGALCRLTFKEAAWDGSWWGTRPDSSGPYYKTAEWSETAKLKQVLSKALSSERPEVVRSLVVSVARHKIDLPELMPIATKLAAEDPSFRPAFVDLLARQRNLTPDHIAFLKQAAMDEKGEVPARVAAIRALSRNVAGLDAAMDAMAAVIAHEKPAGPLVSLVDDFTRDGRHGQNAAAFVKAATTGTPAKREIAYAVLINVAANKGNRAQGKAAAEKAIEAGWEKPATSVPLLRAVGRTRSTAYNDWVEAMVTDPAPEIARAAVVTAQKIGLKTNGPSLESLEVIEKLTYEKTLGLVQSIKGDPNGGVEIFTRLGCVGCHTVSPDETPKGPLLAGVGQKYKRSELAESILKPSAKIAQGFETQYFKTRDDDLDGFVTREAGDEVEIRNAAGIVTVIKKSDIKKRGTREQSMMPEGLVAKLTPQEFANLLAYLESLKTK